MCGIYGILQLDGAPVAAGRARARWARHACIAARTTRASHVDGPCAHRHAAAVDHRPRGRSPAALERRRHAVARLQRRDLQLPRAARASSRRAGHRFKTGSDCEMILHLYAEYGDDFVDHLNGMFALRAVGRAARGACSSAATGSASSRSTSATTARGSCSRPRPRRCSRCPACAPSSTRARCDSYLQLGYVPAPQSIFRGIAQAAAGDAAGRRGRARRRAALLARPGRGRPRADRGASGSSACARGSRSRCACRW